MLPTVTTRRSLRGHGRTQGNPSVTKKAYSFGNYSRVFLAQYMLPWSAQRNCFNRSTGVAVTRPELGGNVDLAELRRRLRMFPSQTSGPSCNGQQQLTTHYKGRELFQILQIIFILPIGSSQEL
jgi:hypothetical protein